MLCLEGLLQRCTSILAAVVCAHAGQGGLQSCQSLEALAAALSLSPTSPTSSAPVTPALVPSMTAKMAAQVGSDGHGFTEVGGSAARLPLVCMQLFVPPFKPAMKHVSDSLTKCPLFRSCFTASG